MKRLLAILAVTLLAHAQQPAGRGNAPQPQAIQRVKTDLYMITGAGGNSTIRIVPEGVILVDGKLPGEANYHALLSLINSVASVPVKYVIVTHHHADHTGNNQTFLDAGAQVLAHENVKKNLVTYEFNPKPAAPSLTYSGSEYTLKLGNATAELHHFGRAHTSGDTVVYFPDLKVVCVSDVVTTGKTGPLIDYAGGGSAADWTNVLDQLLKLDFDAAIPGNGEVLTKSDVALFKAKFDKVMARAKELIRQGVPQEELLSKLQTDDIGWAPRIPKMDVFYAEMGESK